jgi:SAM-dependent methyltransferase
MTGVGDSWGEGYVTDIAYMPGYYPNQSPLHLHLACLLGGVAGIEITAETPLSYLELGCGHGFGALVLAASNPAWRVTGIDFNPAHIAAARELAAEAGIANAAFIEADLASLADDPLAGDVPQADVATMHGLWSWVADPVREGIVALLDRKVRPGGVVQMSYNALPGWQGAIGMQRLLREAGQRLATRSDRQAQAGAEIVRALAETNADHLRGGSFVQSLLEHLGTYNSAYLAHEYMTAAWRPCFHADVVAALAGAKLNWVASAQIIENFTALMLGDEARRVLDRFDDPVMRELIKDMCANRPLRQDVFVRGARRLSNAERDAALGEVMLALLCPPEKFKWEIDAPDGRANLERSFYGPIVEALAAGPRRVRDLLDLPGSARRGNPGEVVGMLVGTQQATRVLAPGAEPDLRVKQLNAAAARRFVRPDNLGNSMALATSGTGAPLSCPMLDLFVANQLHASPVPDPAAWADALGADQPESERQRLREFIDLLIAERAPIWRGLGVLPAASGAPRADEPVL